MELERFKLRCAVHLFLIKDGNILLEKRCNRKYCNGQYDVIASHILGNEDVISAVIRTAKEEVNIDVKQEDLEFVQVMHHNSEGIEYIHYFYKTEKFYGEISNNEPNHCEKLEWVKFEYPIDNLIEYINEAISNYLQDPDNKSTTYGFKENI